MDQVNEGAWSSVAELLHEIGRVPVDESALANSDRSYDHRLVAHGLLCEAAQLAILAAGVFSHRGGQPLYEKRFRQLLEKHGITRAAAIVPMPLTTIS